MSKPWTAEQIHALGVSTDLVTACRATLGIGRSMAYERAQAGELPFPVLRVGNRYVVPVAPLLRLLETGRAEL